MFNMSLAATFFETFVDGVSVLSILRALYYFSSKEPSKTGILFPLVNNEVYHRGNLPLCPFRLL